MNAEQIKNFRQVLFFLVGPVAFIMSDENVIAMRDRFQEELNAMPQEPPEPEFCICDYTRIGQTVHRDGSITCNKCKRERRQ